MTVATRQIDDEAAGVGVFSHVVHGLLGDAVQGDVDVGGQVSVHIGPNLCRDVVASGKALAELSDERAQVGVGDGLRT